MWRLHFFAHAFIHALHMFFHMFWETFQPSHYWIEAGFLIGTPGATDQAPNYTGVQVQTSVNTLPIPIFWGTGKLGPNILAFTDFKKNDAGGGGGKGGKSGAADYSATVQLALCEGLVDSVPLVIVNSNVLKTLSQLGMSLETGTWPDQAPWSYMVENHKGDAFPYPGTAILNRENYDLGPSAAVPNHNVLAIRKSGFQATWCNPSTINATAYPALHTAFPSGIPTADLALVIQDMLTSPQYGIPNFPASSINTTTLLTQSGTDAALQTYLKAMGFGYCPVLDSAETAQSILQRWLQIANCAAVWSGSSLKFIPYCTDTVAGNGVTFTPNLTPVYDLSDDDFVGDSSADPVQVTRTDPSDAYNLARVEITTDDGWFAFLPVEARDQNATELSGGSPRPMPTVTAHEIVGQSQGLLLAQLLLKQQLLWRNTVTFKLSWEFCLLEPMDFFTLTEENLGYIQTLYRVLSCEEDENGEITVTAQKYVPGASSAVAYSGQQTGGNAYDGGTQAQSVNTPVVFQPPTALASPLQVWIAACGAAGAFDPSWGGCQVWLSSDNDNYEHVGDITSPARMGALTASLAAYSGANPDNSNTLSVDLSESAGELITVTSTDAANGATLCYVDGELIGFTTATLALQAVSGEAQTIPATPGPDGSYDVYVANVDSWVSDGGVAYAAGGSLAFTAGTPTTGQYTLEGAVYIFSAGDAGVAVLIAYDYANPNHYALTGLYRGLYGTSAGSHSSGTQFARLDGAVFKWTLQLPYAGDTIYSKLVSFNIKNDGLQDISTLTPAAFAPSGVPTPAALAVFPVVVTRNLITGSQSEIGLSVSVGAPADANLVAQFSYQQPLVTGTGFTDFSPPFGQFQNVGPMVVSPGTYLVRARFVTSDLAQAGAYASVSVVIPSSAVLWTRDDTNNIPVTRDDTTNAIATVHD